MFEWLGHATLNTLLSIMVESTWFGDVHLIMVVVKLMYWVVVLTCIVDKCK
jgi:hypothetical protein